MAGYSLWNLINLHENLRTSDLSRNPATTTDYDDEGESRLNFQPDKFPPRERERQKRPKPEGHPFLRLSDPERGDRGRRKEEAAASRHFRRRRRRV